MKIQKRSIVFGAVFVLLFTLGFAASRLFVQLDLPLADRIVSNLLILLSVGAAVLALFGSSAIHTLSTERRLLYLGCWATILAVLSIVTGQLFPVTSNADIQRSISDDMSTILPAFIIFLLSIIIAVYILLHLYGIILIRRKKSSKNIFWILFTLIIISMILSSFTRINLFATGSGVPSSILDYISISVAVLIIFLMTTCSYRNAWVNYLNKKQKIIALVCSFVIIASVIIVDEVNAGNIQVFLFSISNSGGTFFSITRVFFLVYAVMAFISIVLHLPTAGIFDKKVKQLTSFYQVSSAVSATVKIEKLLSLITDKTLEVIDAKSSWLIMKDEKSGQFVTKAYSQVPKMLMELIKFNRLDSLTKLLEKNCVPLILDQMINRSDLKLPAELIASGGSLVGIPLLSNKNKFNGVLFAWKDTEYGFDEEDKEIIQAFANQTMIALNNRELLKETIEKERLQQEFNVAKEIQLRLLPKSLPEISDAVEIEAVSIPANEVGGDYYDFIRIAENKWGIYIGDVSGKGISAALYMAEMKGFIQSLGRMFSSPKELLMKVNEFLTESLDRKSFVTMIAAVLDHKKKELVYSRSGHCPIVYFDPAKNDWILLESPGLGLGLDNGKVFNKISTEEKINYGPGSVFFFYTDGITELFDEAGNEFGEDRLLNILKDCQKSNSKSYVNTILNEINSFSQMKKHDDITMVVLKIKESA